MCFDLHPCISHRTGVQVSYVLLSIGELLDLRYFHGSLCACICITWAHSAHNFTWVLTVCNFHLDKSVHVVAESHFLRKECVDSAQWRNLSISKWSVRLMQLRIHVVSGQNARDVLMRAGALCGSWTTSSAESQMIRRSRSSIWVRDADLQPVPFRETGPDQTRGPQLLPNSDPILREPEVTNSMRSAGKSLQNTRGQSKLYYANNFW